MTIEEMEVKLEKLLYNLGVSPQVVGFDYLREAAAAWRPGKPLMQLYAYIAQLHGTKVANVERACRHTIFRACERAGYNSEWQRLFADICDPQRGAPTVGEFVARLWREIHAN